MRLDAAQIAGVVYEVESTLVLDRDDWMSRGLHLWPLYRIALYSTLFSKSADARSAARNRVGRNYFSTSRFERADAERPVVWLLSNGMSYVNAGDSTIEKFFTPIAETLVDLGGRPVLIDRRADDVLSSSRLQGVERVWCGSHVTRAKSTGIVSALMGGALGERRRCDLINEAIAGASDKTYALSPLEMAAKVSTLQAMRRWFCRAMKRSFVRALFLETYYDVVGFAAVAAANDLGIPSIDVQHGVTGKHHPAYARWSNVPDDRYALLPTHFWSWSKEDADIINSWVPIFPGDGNAALNCGNPYTAEWKDLQSPWRRKSHALEQSLSDMCGDRKTALVTLQPGLTSAQDCSPLLDVMSRLDDWFWMLRLHPTDLEAKPGIEKLLSDRQVANFNIDLATELPIILLLANSDWHLTHSSSCVLEAEELGCPSILWSKYGAQLFEDQIRSGSTYFCPSGEEIEARFGDGAGNKGFSGNQESLGTRVGARELTSGVFAQSD